MVKARDLNRNIERPTVHLETVKNVSVYFDPKQMVAVLATQIQRSKQVFGCVAWLTHEKVLGALEKTDATIIMTKHKRNRNKRRFRKKYVGTRKLLMHHKFMVGFDDLGPCWVSYGSFNPTRGALTNLENMTLTLDRTLAGVFYQEYLRIMAG